MIEEKGGGLFSTHPVAAGAGCSAFGTTGFVGIVLYVSVAPPMERQLYASHLFFRRVSWLFSPPHSH